MKAIAGEFPDKLQVLKYTSHKHQVSSGGATPGRARSNDLARRSAALAPPWLKNLSVKIKINCFASVIV